MMKENYVVVANKARENNAINVNRMVYDMPTKRRVAACSAFVLLDDGTIGKCNCTVTSNKGKKVLPFGNGNKYGVTWCEAHKTVQSHMAGYTVENNIIVGKPNKKGVSVSLEIEMDAITDEAAATLEEYKVLLTHDASVKVEGKSPIALNDNYTAKLLGTLQFLNDNGEIDLNSDNVGMHCHVGLYNNPVDFMTVFPTMKEYMQFFGGLFEYLYTLDSDTITRFFGRDFTYYARLPRYNNNGEIELISHDYSYNSRSIKLYDDNSCCGYGSCSDRQHLLIFNMQHEHTIECRLYKYHDAVQYRNCMMCLEDTATYIRDYYNAINAGMDRKTAASKYGKKVLAIYKKSIESINA